jgi:ABC-2 type transport system ATP-binding protein
VATTAMLPDVASATTRELALEPAIEACAVSRGFGPVTALDGVDLAVAPGEVHALLGPNGAGKTTLLRTLTGLVEPDAGSVHVLGLDVTADGATLRSSIGFVPSGDRSFYLRLSGEENLVFFARLHGLRLRAARERARALLADVGLPDVGRRPVSAYSHGMQKRLLVARALLADPGVLLVDEATHDLDPEAAARVRALVRELADRGAAVLWATQRIEEIRGFADTVTFLAGGRVRFAGPVAGLLAHARTRRYVLRAHGQALDVLQAALGASAGVSAADPGHLVLALRDDVSLGEAIAALAGAGATVRDCRQERSEAEGAFLALLEEAGA